LPSADEDVETAEDAEITGPVDEARAALLEALTTDLGDAIVASHLAPGRDLWIRVTNLSWTETADYLRNGQRFRFFDWLSAIDWMRSPFGRSLDAAVDLARTEPGPSNDPVDDESGPGTGAQGITGGNTRFQVFARVHNLSTGLGLNLKADVPGAGGGRAGGGRADEPPSIGTWVKTYPGAAWHEREVHEMFGITFLDNRDLRNLYLPTDFEGFPLRKDYPLLARLVKPWPGIIDVEPMPEVESPSTSNPEGGA